MWLQPSSRAIRLIPHPRLLNRSIAATSSGVCITSLHGNSPHGAGCIPSSILRPPLRRGVHFSPSTRVQFILSADSSHRPTAEELRITLNHPVNTFSKDDHSLQMLP